MPSAFRSSESDLVQPAARTSKYRREPQNPLQHGSDDDAMGFKPRDQYLDYKLEGLNPRDPYLDYKLAGLNPRDPYLNYKLEGLNP